MSMEATAPSDQPSDSFAIATKETKKSREVREPLDSRENKEARVSKEGKEARDVKESRERSGDSKESRESVAAKSTQKVEATEKEKEAAGASNDKLQNLQELTLNDLQDVGIQLRQIKQQAILIYEEASRTPVPLTASPDVPEFHTIPITHQPHAKLLPARQEWLVFFLATMEPVIRQMRKDAKDIEQGAETLVLPAASEKKLEPLWEGWLKNVQLMNSHLDQLVPLFDDAPHNNSRIQEVAVSIFDDVKRLEAIRKEVFRAVQLMERKTPDQKILVGP